MAMKLFLAEKPSQARRTSTFLNANRKREEIFEGEGIVIAWAFGHLLADAEPADYDPQYK